MGGTMEDDAATTRKILEAFTAVLAALDPLSQAGRVRVLRATRVLLMTDDESIATTHGAGCICAECEGR